MQQVDAARRLDGASLADLNSRRSDLMFELQVILQERLPQSESLRELLQEEARTLRLLEDRLARVAGGVSQVLAAASPDRPTDTYGRSGRMGR
jgi:hypothetical protein